MANERSRLDERSTRGHRMSAPGKDEQFTVRLTLQDGYAFSVDFSAQDIVPLMVDEPPPLGQGRGPNPARLLAAAVGSCLSASLLFCLRKFGIAVSDLQTTVDVTLARNDRGRQRIGGIRVRLAPELDLERRERMDRCLQLFQDYCMVTESVRDGIDVDVVVENTPAPAMV